MSNPPSTIFKGQTYVAAKLTRAGRKCVAVDRYMTKKITTNAVAQFISQHQCTSVVQARHY